MNIFNKIILGILILGTGAQAINAHPWTTRAITAATLTGLGLGYGTVKYYGFNTATNAVLEKCANAKKWFTDKLSDAIFGSYKKQIKQLQQNQTAFLESRANTKAQLKEENLKTLAEKDAQLKAQEALTKHSIQHAKNIAASHKLSAVELAAKIKKAHDAHVVLKADHIKLKADVRNLLDAYNIDLTDLINNMPHLPQATADYLAHLQEPAQ